MSTVKTLEILDLFDQNTRRLTVAEMALKLNHPQSSVYRYVRILKEKGYLIDDNDGVYRLGYKFLKFSKIVSMDANITTIAYPIMQKLTDKIGETSLLMVHSNLQSICLLSVSSIEPIIVSSQVGQVSPLYGGASSKALLAYLGEDVLHDLFENGIVKKHTDNTITNIDDLKRDLQQIRDKGYAYSIGEIDHGVVGFGVPIFNYNNKVIASLSIVGPEERLLNKNNEEIIEELVKARDEIQNFL